MRGSSRAGHRNLDPRTRRLHRRHQSLCHSGRPSDTARVAEYEAGPYAGFGDEIMQAFSAIVPGDADASLVADAIVNVVDTPFSKRPFRVHIDPSQDGAEVAFGVIDRVRK